ncbi:uncharacterized protein LOC129762514 [Toxorhynchites rutilus septentrionalis]|uniref:uncharacterized protein LOC129762514 n=1 Tax=Toxorhynchites rutilus septentrionalis TaxID=329112 RepID=UPI0024791509|nr:uncharacterized protein LOC129762514 [Toxorhynchites rutilus septentrionalis]
MTMIFRRALGFTACVILYCQLCSALPFPEGSSGSRSLFKRQTTGTSDISNPPKIKNEVAAFLESGRMNNDYVWVDVTTKAFVAVPGNDLEFGDCSDTDELIYFDNTVIENSGPSILNGTLEIYIDAPVNITCVRVVDQIQDGTGGVPTYNSMGSNWAKIDVAGQYGKDFHFHILVYGIRLKKSALDKQKESNDSQYNLV